MFHGRGASRGVQYFLHIYIVCIILVFHNIFYANRTWRGTFTALNLLVCWFQNRGNMRGGDLLVTCTYSSAQLSMNGKFNICAPISSNMISCYLWACVTDVLVSDGLWIPSGEKLCPSSCGIWRVCRQFLGDKCIYTIDWPQVPQNLWNLSVQLVWPSHTVDCPNAWENNIAME